MNKKLLGKKAYGSIPHLPHSRLGEGDHSVEDGQAKICLKQERDRHDIIIVQEKLDGSNCCVAKVDGEILALTRAGYEATTSKYEQHQFFAHWVRVNWMRFDQLLKEGERVCGEWLALAHGTRYDLKHEPFVVFDIMTGDKRLPYWEFLNRVMPHNFITPRLISYGKPIDHKKIIKQLEAVKFGAVDSVEGYIVRVERQGKVDFLAKWVRQDKEDGKYFKENYGEDVWNWRPIKFIKE
ncbi:MAG: RNA ligase family protein [Candidatus Peribacteraceae bacterium]|nr:RNA ligase family protein [Candidatus Peribacteraceae bacterium]